MMYCNNCCKDVEEPTHICSDGVNLSAEQVDNLRKMWENGCPSYEDLGYWDCCWFCNERKGLRSGKHQHRADCPWLTLDELFTPTDAD